MITKLVLALILLAWPIPAHFAVGQEQPTNGDEATCHFELGEYAFATHDDVAEREFKEAIRLRGGKYPAAWNRLASIYRRQLRLTDRLEAFSRYVEQTRKPGPQDVDLLVKYRSDARLQERINASTQPSLEDLLEFVIVGVECEGPKGGFPVAERAVSLYPDSAQALILMIRYLPLEQSARRFGLIQQALAMAPDEPEAWTDLGSSYFNLRDLNSALAAYQRALEVSHNKDIYAWRGAGTTLMLMGRPHEAIAAFRKYLELGPANDPNRSGIKDRIKELEKLDRGEIPD